MRIVSLLSLLLFSLPTLAYVGPGGGLAALGSLMALLATVLLMVIGYFWYPIKRRLKGRKKDTTPVLPKPRPDSIDVPQPQQEPDSWPNREE